MGHGSVLGQRPARALAVRGEETEAPQGQSLAQGRGGVLRSLPSTVSQLKEPATSPAHPQDLVINSLLPWTLPLPLGEQRLGRGHLD